MNQTEIDELRERIDAAISTVCNGMAAMSIPADPRDVDLVLADCAKALAALEEARAERYTLKEKLAAMDLLLNNAERVVRDGIADRDAAETQAWDALGRPDGTHDTSNVQRLCEAHGALKAKLAALVDYLRDEMATSSKAIPSTADEAIGDAERVLFCQQLLEHEALAAAKVQP